MPTFKTYSQEVRSESNFALVQSAPSPLESTGEDHRRMARGDHGLPNVSAGHAILYPSTPCERATPETASWLFQGWPAAVFCPFGHTRPCAYAGEDERKMNYDCSEFTNSATQRFERSQKGDQFWIEFLGPHQAKPLYAHPAAIPTHQYYRQDDLS
jgi:hypothetical protein